MHINVTEEHIRKGTQCSTRKCPVALAIRDAFPQAEDIGVGNFSVLIIYDDHHEKYDFPQEVRTRIHSFDIHRTMQPFSFTLTPGAPS